MDAELCSTSFVSVCVSTSWTRWTNVCVCVCVCDEHSTALQVISATAPHNSSLLHRFLIYDCWCGLPLHKRPVSPKLQQSCNLLVTFDYNEQTKSRHPSHEEGKIPLRTTCLHSVHSFEWLNEQMLPSLKPRGHTPTYWPSQTFLDRRYLGRIGRIIIVSTPSNGVCNSQNSLSRGNYVCINLYGVTVSMLLIQLDSPL